MNINKLSLLAAVLILFVSNTAMVPELENFNHRNDIVIRMAIKDFSKSCRLYKKDSVFSVSVYDVGAKMIAVRIGKVFDKLLFDPNKSSRIFKALPTRYYQADGKLFFWRDDDMPADDETVSVLTKHNLLQLHQDSVNIPDFTINDAQKAAHYYFCASDFSKFRRVTTNKAIGYYPAPNLKCN